MGDQIGWASGFDDVHLRGTPSMNGAAKCGHNPIEDAIREQLRREWLGGAQSENCFDASAEQMEKLLSFYSATSSEDDTSQVRAHLLDCPRCRFIYAKIHETQAPDTVQMSAAKPPTSEPLPQILRWHLRSGGPVVFPGGEVAEGAWEFGLLNELSAEDAEEVTDVVADRAWRKLRAVLPSKELVIVCFSPPLHRIGKRLAARMVAAGAGDLHVVMADDFFNPKLWCNPKELRGRHVVVFVDVVHSGGLVNRLLEVCRQANPRSLVGLTVIDQSQRPVSSERMYALWTEPPEGRTRPVGEISANARFFDPVAARARARMELPPEVADPARAKETIQQRLREMGPLFNCIEQTGALKRDAKIGGVHYPWAVDLLCLLANDHARKELVDRAVARLAGLGAQGPWCLVYPAERHKRAGTWAKLLADATGWQAVAIGLHGRQHFRPLTPRQREALAGCRRALIVDAAVRTGKTLQSLAAAIRARVASPATIAAFYAFDGLFDDPRSELEQRLNVEIHSLFRLPLGVPTEPVGRHCRARLNETLSELANVKSSGSGHQWVGVVRRYCRKKLRVTGRPPTRGSGDAEERLRLALDEGERGVRARLEHACDPPRPSLVKHLDVGFALREPQTRNVLHGFLCNSMPAEFIEWCALALATQEDYDWLDRDWLLLHQRFLTNADSDRWQFLACVSYWVRRRGDTHQVERIRRAVDDFRRQETRAETLPLFPEPFEEQGTRGVLSSRCETLITVLSAD